jgi:hypothetical protein
VGGTFQLGASPRQKHDTLSLKITKAKKGWGFAQAIKHLSSKLGTPSSNPVLPKTNTPNKQKQHEMLAIST